MNSVSEKGKGGTFRLSGRRSIHNHTHCPFWNCEAMGRYGLSINKRQEHGMCSTSPEGTDEVDNIMSKMARESTPITIRKNNEIRRNSLNLHNQFQQSNTDESDEDSNLLSKSCPATLTSYSCSSEEAEEANNTYYSNESASSSRSQYRINTSRGNNMYNTTLQNTQSVDGTNYTMQRSTKGVNKLLLSSIIITAIIAIVLAYDNMFKTEVEISNIIYDKYSFYTDVKDVGNKYKVSENTILQVRAGIATIFEKKDTGSFIFAYNSGKRDFNLVNFNNFVNEMASAAAKYLRNDTKIVQHVVVDTSNLQIQSDKELMNIYVEDVDKTGVMLVKDLDRVPSALVMAFHYYCDEYNPLVKKSAIFFTLNVARCSNVSSEKHSHKNIEKCLADKWVTLPQDNIRPLLNRVVNVVIDLTSDF